MNTLCRQLSILLVSLHATLAPAQDAAPADRNAINTRTRPGDMMADSPVTFPQQGALPAKYPPDDASFRLCSLGRQLQRERFSPRL